MTDQERIERLELELDDLKDERDDLRRRLQAREAMSEPECFACWETPMGPRDGIEVISLTILTHASKHFLGTIARRAAEGIRWEVRGRAFDNVWDAKRYLIKDELKIASKPARTRALEALLRSTG